MNQCLQVVAGIVLDHLAERSQHVAVGEHDFEAEHLIARGARLDHAIAARVSRQIAADLARAACTQIEGEFETRFGGGFLRGLQGRAGAHGQRGRRCVDFFYAGETFERQSNIRRARNRAARETGHAALRHHRLMRCVANGQRARNFFRAARQKQRGWTSRHRGGSSRSSRARRSARQRAPRRHRARHAAHRALWKAVLRYGLRRLPNCYLSCSRSLLPSAAAFLR